MRFTIITPNLNYGRFLGDCLQSVAVQEGVEVEQFVFDAGSKDNSSEVAKRFPHIIWIEEPDRGMSHAINKGFDRASGDWVMWLNADDRLKPGALAEIAQVLAVTDADVVYGSWDFIDQEGRFLRHVRAPRWSRFVNVHHHCCVGSTAAFYRKSTVIDPNHRLREDFHYVMDGEFYARLDAAGLRLQRASGCIADFRLHNRNTSQLHLGKTTKMDAILSAERQHVESRAIRRVYGITLFRDPYLTGLTDGLLWIVAKIWKFWLKR